MSESLLPYRPGVGVLLLDWRARIFVGRRIDQVAEAWQMPQGGIDEGESPVQAMWRELKEEIGTDKASILAESADWYDYDLPPELRGKVWGGRFRGQRQKWFALQFLGQDSDIDLEVEHPEFNAWRWLELAEIPTLAVPFKRDLYRRLVVEFAPVAKAVRAAAR